MSKTRGPGTVDENGILWKSTMPGQLMHPPASHDTIWKCIEDAAKNFTSMSCVGERVRCLAMKLGALHEGPEFIPPQPCQRRCSRPDVDLSLRRR
jgi:hypothetical protein